MPDEPGQSTIIRVSELSPRKAQPFDLRPEEPRLRELAAELGITGLRKLRFAGEVRADGKADWKLSGTLGATVTQDCVVTLAPVTTRIDEDVTRRFLKDWPPAEEQGEEVEMPDDETIDPLEEEIDLQKIMVEVLALALPDYPRAKDAKLEVSQASPPGAVPITDAETKPFSALEGLKKKLEDGSD